MFVVVEHVAVVVVLRGEVHSTGDAGVGIHVVGGVVGGNAVLQYLDAVAEEVELIGLINSGATLETGQLTDDIVAVTLGASIVEHVFALGHVADGVVGQL